MKNYKATFITNENVEVVNFSASNLIEAKKRAQFHKRRNDEFKKAKVEVRLANNG